jgi:hypothetical protein
MAICDGCGASGEAEECRSPRGTLSWAFLPLGWSLVGRDAPGVHLCGACVASSVEPFGDRREAFEARFEQLGPGLVADIAASLGLPGDIARRWAGEFREKQERMRA